MILRQYFPSSCESNNCWFSEWPKIKGNVAFLGGPLTFLSELRHRFIETLQLLPEQVIFPDDSQYYVAIGAAILANNGQTRTIDSLIQQLESQKKCQGECKSDAATFV